jgi:alpha-amylase
LALLFGGTSFGNLQTVQAASAVTRASIHDGAILHAFCWNFNTIKDNMADIAAAGYTAVQTSPINECLSTEPGLTLNTDEGKWYYHYQPTDWTIGNYQLGTRDEFRAMCDEADKYGIGIIVDIDPNHTTPVFDQVSDALKSAAGGEDSLYHIGAKDGSMSYDDRISVTYDAMGGLPDVDTENEGFQKYFYEFLQDCIACGADGFRIDTAKHIALPDDGVAEEYAGQEDRNNFYPNMKAFINENAGKSYNDLFVYGEVLDGDAARLAAYQDMLGGTCASNYGGTIRTAVSSGSLAVNKFTDYKISDDVKGDTTYTADENKLVTWVESHDNYINDKSYNSIDDTDVILGWAVIAARKAGTPLFFSRPAGSSKENPWGKNEIGPAGSDIYKDPQVVAVNKFRTEMVGEDEYLRNPSGNNSVLMIERGDKGLVIVNATEGEFSLDSETNLANGNYVDSVKGHDGFYQVTDGVITGTVPAQSVVVLDKQAEGDYSTLFFFNSKGWNQVNATVGDTVYNCSNTGDGWWKVVIPQKEFTVKFTDGGDNSKEYTIAAESGKYMSAESDNLYVTKSEAEDAIGVITKSIYFFNTQDWKSVYAYGWYDGGQQIFGQWPGIPINNEGGYWWRADIKMMSDKDFNIIFNNGNGSQTVNIEKPDMTKPYVALTGEKEGSNLAISYYSSKDDASEALGIYPDKTTVHFYNTRGWDTVSAYTWGTAASVEWPGKSCEDEGDGWWKFTIPSAPSADLGLIFNNNGAGQQTGDLTVDSIAKVYFWGNQKFASKAEAEKAAYDYEHTSEELVKEDGCTLIYFYNANVWDMPYVYAWGGDYNNCAGDWPGTKLTKISGNWFGANISTEALESGMLHLIFSNNGSTQCPDNIVTDTSKLYFICDVADGFESEAAVENYLNPAPQPSAPSQPSGSSQTSAPAAAVAQAPTQVAIVSPDVPKAADTNNQQVKATTKVAANTETAVLDEEVEDEEAVEEESNEEIEDTADTSEELQETEVTADTAIDAEVSNDKEKQFPVVPVAVVVGIAVVAGLGYVGLKGRKVR